MQPRDRFLDLTNVDLHRLFVGQNLDVLSGEDFLFVMKLQATRAVAALGGSLDVQ